MAIILFLSKKFLQLVVLIQLVQLFIATNKLLVDEDGRASFVVVLAPSGFRQIIEVSIGLVDLVEGLLETDEEVVSLVGSFGIVSEDDDLVRAEEVFELVSHIFVCVCGEKEIFFDFDLT